MTQENKELLLKDISARLSYGVKCEIVRYRPVDGEVVDIFTDTITFENISKYTDARYKIRPYLFPMSSMTEDQYDEFFAFFHDVEMKEIETSRDYFKAAYLGENAKRDWLNKNHFDYRYLIEKDLAIDATNKNIC